MTTTFCAHEIPAAELTESLLSPPSAEPLSGEITVRSKAFFISPDEKIVSGTWESEPGVSRWEFTNRGEIIHLLSGRMTVIEDGGEPAEILAGTSAVFPLGWRGEWTIHEKSRKVFVVYAQ